MEYVIPILIGILFLFGIWYTVGALADARMDTAARESEASRRRSLEEAALRGALEEKEKDLREAAEATATPDARDGRQFLRDSFN